MKEGKCFYCKEAGHVSRECPVKKNTMDLKTLEPISQSDSEALEIQGKENP
jgi:hypothetical protein